jgi:hypothetical protein
MIMLLLFFLFSFGQDHCVKDLCPPGTICIACSLDFKSNTSWPYCFDLTCSVMITVHLIQLLKKENKINFLWSRD